MSVKNEVFIKEELEISDEFIDDHRSEEIFDVKHIKV